MIGGPTKADSLARLQVWRQANPERVREANREAQRRFRIKQRKVTLQQKARELQRRGVSFYEIVALVVGALDYEGPGVAGVQDPHIASVVRAVGLRDLPERSAEAEP